MATEFGITRTSGAGLTRNADAIGTFDRSGALMVMDFFTKAMLDCRGFQIRAGTITTPLVGDVAITDTNAEFAADPAAGMEIIPVFQNISVRLGTGTLFEFATKGVANASSAGAAFVPLPLNGATLSPLTGAVPVASTTARVAAAGGVTVTAELATTTTRYWSFAQPIAMGAYVADCKWEPLRPPRIPSGRCLYTQIAAATTGPSYYANLDFLEFVQGQIGG